MYSLLLDANLSPETAQFLRTRGYLVVSLIEEKFGSLSDEEVVAYAKKKHAVVVTFDHDFGEIYHFKEKGKIGVIVLRMKDQTIESVNQILGNLLPELARVEVPLSKTLIIVTAKSYRVINS